MKIVNSVRGFLPFICYFYIDKVHDLNLPGGMGGIHSHALLNWDATGQAIFIFRSAGLAPAEAKIAYLFGMAYSLNCPEPRSR